MTRSLTPNPLGSVATIVEVDGIEEVGGAGTEEDEGRDGSVAGVWGAL